ncbi:MAG: hypothetical protein ABI999_01735 [Acidobacteriota bacterium]
MRVLVHLADVKTVYVDDSSFKITSSSCGTYAGGYYLPCPEHSLQRVKFLVALKRWLGKTGLTVVDHKEDAEAILDGTLSIDDDMFRRDRSPHPHQDRDRDKRQSNDKHSGEYRSTVFEPIWSVTAWATNQKGRRIWDLGAGYPGISYAGEQPKIEGKKLAKAIQYDIKHHR